MILILLIFLVALIIGSFAWVFLVSPSSDRDRIKADVAGTGVKVVKIERIGSTSSRGDMTWVANHPTPTNGGSWYRVYLVTVERQDDFPSTYQIGVQTKLFGLPALIRYDRQQG